MANITTAAPAPESTAVYAQFLPLVEFVDGWLPPSARCPSPASLARARRRSHASCIATRVGRPDRSSRSISLTSEHCRWRARWAATSGPSMPVSAIGRCSARCCLTITARCHPDTRRRRHGFSRNDSAWMSRLASYRFFALHPATSAAAVDVLVTHPWPGNARELGNVLKRALILCDGPVMDRGHIRCRRAGAARFETGSTADGR